VGGAGVYLLSDLGAGVTGEVHHVDCGYHTVGMVAVDAAEEVSALLASLNGKA
jgi:enoyl-[acyl-carrier protein] reductase I